MKGGVLVIGSLLWDNDQGKFVNHRKNWREKRLLLEKRIQVFAPIRYGRKSKDVYTMVFSRVAEQQNNWGTTYFLPFKKEINSFPELIEEAESLSNAEGGKDMNLVKGNEDKWCVIGILFNPRFDKMQKDELLRLYEEKLNAQGLSNEYPSYCIPPEESILTSRGEIAIQWPRTTDPKDQNDFDSFDFILATCPRQNITSYPDPLSIKSSALAHERKYFFNNIRNGITTFQDREVLNSMVGS